MWLEEPELPDTTGWTYDLYNPNTARRYDEAPRTWPLIRLRANLENFDTRKNLTEQAIWPGDFA